MKNPWGDDNLNGEKMKGKIVDIWEVDQEVFYVRFRREF